MLIPEQDSFYVYIVECCDQSYYTGWTINLKKRILTHQSGKGAKYTRAHAPVKLVYYEEYSNKTDAMSREYQIKQLSRIEKECLVKAS